MEKNFIKNAYAMIWWYCDLCLMTLCSQCFVRFRSNKLVHRKEYDKNEVVDQISDFDSAYTFIPSISLSLRYDLIYIRFCYSPITLLGSVFCGIFVSGVISSIFSSSSTSTSSSSSLCVCSMAFVVSPFLRGCFIPYFCRSFSIRCAFIEIFRFTYFFLLLRFIYTYIPRDK